MVDDLRDLTHHDEGIAHAGARRPEALLALPAVRRRLSAEPSNPAVAIRDALEDLERSNVKSLSDHEFLAIRILLAIDRQPVIEGRRIDLAVGYSTAFDRAEYAVWLLYPHRRDRDDKTHWFRRARRAEGEPVSREWTLLSRLRADLDRLEPPESLNRGLAAMPTVGGGLAADVASDLLGTWKGVVTGPMMLRVEPGPERPERVDGYLVFEPDTDGAVQVTNYVEWGVSRMVAQRLCVVDGVRRLVAVYEAETASHRGPDPSHRGAMILSIEGDPAIKLDGPFWTDRLTYGRLTFTSRSPAIATGFEEAAACW
ncbi:MAG TPA: hypothetical protein VF257_01430 [Solirubrobacteraceae bacterium]